MAFFFISTDTINKDFRFQNTFDGLLLEAENQTTDK